MRFIIKNDMVKQNCIEAINKLAAEPVMCVEIKPYVKKRSIDQNSLYFMWVDIFADCFGYTKAEMHDVFRVKFLPIKKRMVKDVELTELTSTTELNTKEFSEYMKNIELVSVEMGITLVYPEDLIYTLE